MLEQLIVELQLLFIVPLLRAFAPFQHEDKPFGERVSQVLIDVAQGSDCGGVINERIKDDINVKDLIYIIMKNSEVYVKFFT